MEIKLLTLHLHNFKGIKDLIVEADTKDLKIYGDNETGKTTIADAFYWLLFNKDSQNNADFGIKTLKNGEPLHNLEHSVTGVFDIDGKKTTLKKIFKEKWTKKRGSANAEFTGHESLYEINDVPKKKKEFDGFISSIIEDEEVFKLVTNPLYFNALKADKKREILINISGDLSDEAVIEHNEELAPLKALLSDYTAEEIKAKNNRDRTAVNDELKQIPVRVDEIHHSMTDLSNLDKSEIENSIKEKESQIEQISNDMSDIRNGGLEIDLRQAVKQSEYDLNNYINNYDEGASEDLRKLEYKNEADKSELSILKKKSEYKQEEIKYKENYKQSMLDDYHKQKEALEVAESEHKTFEVKEVCECCGQQLPESEVEAHREKQQEEYNKQRSENIETLNSDLKVLITKGKNVKGTIENMKNELSELQLMIERLESEINKDKETITALQNKKIDPKETKDYKILSAQLEAQKEKLTTVEKEATEKIDALKDKLRVVKAELSDLNTTLAEFDKNKRNEARIKELEQRQTELAEQYEELEHQEHLLNEFTTTKVNLLEDSISEKFKYARFKLFEPQINGGLKEICETTYLGVPYSKGLNTAARINVGLDIINTLSKHYDFIAPIIVDNAESISQLEETEAQQVQLVVSEPDKKLRMENK